MRYSAVLGAFLIVALAGTGTVLAAVQQCPPVIVSYVTNSQASVYRPCIQQPTLLQDRGYVDQRLNAQLQGNGCGVCPSDDLFAQRSSIALDGTVDCQNDPTAMNGPNIMTTYVPQVRLPNGSCAPIGPASAALRSAQTLPVARRSAAADPVSRGTAFAGRTDVSATRKDLALPAVALSTTAVPSVAALRVPQIAINLDKIAPVRVDPMRAAMPVRIVAPQPQRTEPRHVDPWFNGSTPQSWTPPAMPQPSRPMTAPPPARPGKPPL